MRYECLTFDCYGTLVDWRRWLHVAQSRFHDLAIAERLGIPVAWINRFDEPAGAGLRPVATSADLAGLGHWLT